MDDLSQQRWRYTDENGRAIWLPLDPDFLCILCNNPVGELSAGGPAVCGSCDCGNNRDGSKWSVNDFATQAANAKRRLAAIPDDPVWSKYESAHTDRRAKEPTHD